LRSAGHAFGYGAFLLEAQAPMCLPPPAQCLHLNLGLLEALDGGYLKKKEGACKAAGG